MGERLDCARFAAALALFVWGEGLLVPPSANAADSAAIFMYHRFGENELPSTSIRIEQFESHLAEISTGSYKVLPLLEIVAALREGRPLPDRTLALTVDDAFLSVYTEAWPRLRAAGLPFTLFVATDAVDQGHRGYMNWDQVRDLARSGVTIGHHSASHLHMPLASPGRITSEIERANARFEAELGAVPELFAYPYGEYSTVIRDMVESAGFVAAFGQNSGVAYAGQDLLALPRFALNETYGTIARFRLAASALPLKVSDVTPRDVFLNANPPAFGFTVTPEVTRLDQLACYASHIDGATHIERLGERRFEVRLAKPFPPGRGRINCTVPAGGQRWRWYGIQFFVP